MTQENEMNHDGDGFEAAPNMVPGEIEAAEQFDPANRPARKSGMKTKLFFVFAGLLFAGGWGYANKEDFKDALGIQPEANHLGSTSLDGDPLDGEAHGCCPAMMADMVGAQTASQVGSCPLAAEADAVAKKETCCEDGRKKAMIAALLEGTKIRTDDATKPEDATEEVATPEKKEAKPQQAPVTDAEKAEAKTEVKKADAEKPATAK